MPDIHHGADQLGTSAWSVLYDGIEEPGVGLRVGLLRLGEAQTEVLTRAGREVALVVLSGRGWIRCPDGEMSFDRHSWINESPMVVHAAQGVRLELGAESATEIAVVETSNERHFATRLIAPSRVRVEQRGEGKLEGTAHRVVRTAFDGADSPLAARLVIGEVVNRPGRWSSYPPHHHQQPEVYYYRFDRPQGYGHAECGDHVYKVREHDVLRIPGGMDHAQCAAPGYYMYYLWAIRHLDDAKYTGFEVSPAHQWTFVT